MYACSHILVQWSYQHDLLSFTGLFSVMVSCSLVIQEFTSCFEEVEAFRVIAVVLVDEHGSFRAITDRTDVMEV